MSDTAITIYILCMIGWIPILAIGKAVAMIVDAIKGNYETEDTENDTI